MKGRVNTGVDYQISKNHAEALDRYIDHHIPTGGFLRACLENDFVEACAMADPMSVHSMQGIALYLKWEMPPLSWGSSEHVDAWIAAGRRIKT